MAMYVMVYERFCVFALPWDSPWTWWIAFLAVDLAYYWFHRMAHGEDNYHIWASHGEDNYHIRVSHLVLNVRSATSPDLGLATISN